ncbi:hypothetical protein Pma05_07730 [Plantactinospora mayteni]|uniref:Uncharacterized protein n=1 Tax=Plantactinospora mayteni TaxID=566021 RepID=A0ABQ4EHK7_9ACTN|nr:hypothetical protein Pma05_07730 [Plantactinospora mayteni]
MPVVEGEQALTLDEVVLPHVPFHSSFLPRGDRQPDPVRLTGEGCARQARTHDDGTCVRSVWTPVNVRDRRGPADPARCTMPVSVDLGPRVRSATGGVHLVSAMRPKRGRAFTLRLLIRHGKQFLDAG